MGPLSPLATSKLRVFEFSVLSMPTVQQIASKDIYHGLPVFPETTNGLSAIVVGATGISGDHMVRRVQNSFEKPRKANGHSFVCFARTLVDGARSMLCQDVLQLGSGKKTSLISL